MPFEIREDPLDSPPVLALRQLDPGHGEIKSMHTDAAWRGRGVASAILRSILHEARRRGYRRLSLETGSMPEFVPARSLYEGHGFAPCAPFGDYTEDPNSLFLTLELPVSSGGRRALEEPPHA